MTDLVPTEKLRWLRRPGDAPVLQQWYAEDVPGYMRNTAKGEWRDVETVNG